MVGVNDIVITGIGCVTPLGIGRAALWDGLRTQQTAVRHVHVTAEPNAIAYAGAPIQNFDAKQFVTPRKAIKVMGLEVQLAYAAAHLAWQDAQLDSAKLNADRLGVVYGSEMMPGDPRELVDAVRACSQSGQMDAAQWGQEFSKHIFPLWMLRNLPNMPACHVGIAIDARGPNNTIAQEEVSGMLALSEAVHVIEREQADLMLVGGVGSRLTATRLMYRAPGIYNAHPASEQRPGCVPFDRRRSGIVPADSAVAIVLERRSHAVRRGAPILAQVLSVHCGCGIPDSKYAGSSAAIARSIVATLDESGCDGDSLGHVSAQGYSERKLDVSEAQAISQTLPIVSVSAYSSYFGTAGAASGLMNLVASLIAGQAGMVLPVLGYNEADDECPLNVCRKAQSTDRPAFLSISFTPAGHAAAAIIQCNR